VVREACELRAGNECASEAGNGNGETRTGTERESKRRARNKDRDRERNGTRTDVFTGIVTALGTIRSGSSTAAGARLRIACVDRPGRGESIAVSTGLSDGGDGGGGRAVRADASEETLARSTLGGGRGRRPGAPRAGVGGRGPAGRHCRDRARDAWGRSWECREGGGRARAGWRVRCRMGVEAGAADRAEGFDRAGWGESERERVAGAEFDVMIVPHTAGGDEAGGPRGRARGQCGDRRLGEGYVRGDGAAARKAGSPRTCWSACGFVAAMSGRRSVGWSTRSRRSAGPDR